jgi:hypothetical protein
MAPDRPGTVMPASGRLASVGISGRSALVACGQLAGAAAWVSTQLGFDAVGGTALSSLDERGLQLPRSRPAGGGAAQRRRRAGTRRSGARPIGYGGDDSRIITDQLIDNSLCGYRFAGLPRILAIAREARTRNARVSIAVVHETPVAALVDGGNNVGYVAVYRGAEIAIAKAKQSGSPRSASTTAISAGATPITSNASLQERTRERVPAALGIASPRSVRAGILRAGILRRCVLLENFAPGGHGSSRRG